MAQQVSIRKGDQVRVVAGRDKGKTGRVLSVNASKGVASVEHVNMLKRHTRPNPQKQIKGGVVEREGSIHLSNLMLMCRSCGKPTRVGHHTLPEKKGGKTQRERICRRCEAALD